MEKQNPQSHAQRIELLNFILAVKENDTEKTAKLLEFFKEDILALSRYTTMNQEDTVQSINLELLKLFKKAG